MEGEGQGEEEGDLQARAWMHRQNIQRYKALLRNRAHGENHDQVRKLLHEEEEKLRSLGSNE